MKKVLLTGKYLVIKSLALNNFVQGPYTDRGETIVVNLTGTCDKCRAVGSEDIVTTDFNPLT